jgi:hypothetical protein
MKSTSHCRSVSSENRASVQTSGSILASPLDHRLERGLIADVRDFGGDATPERLNLPARRLEVLGGGQRVSARVDQLADVQQN